MRDRRTTRGPAAMITKLRLIAILAVTVVTACSGAATPSASPPGPSLATPRPSATSASSAPSARPSLQPSARPSPSPPPDVAGAPTGPWNHVAWIAAGAVNPLGPANVSVFGWSRGFVGFATSGDGTSEGPITITASSSTDGLRWTSATKPDTTGLDGAASIRTVLEGADGLLAVGYESAGTCGGPSSVNALWSSADGTTWRRLALPADFRVSRVVTLDGGPSGYIATGLRADGATPGIWTSLDGARWRLRPNPKVAAGSVVVADATSFSGGYVVAGAILGPDGCGGASSLHPSLWWSSDGAAWS